MNLIERIEGAEGPITEGTKTERCDYCQHWHPLSQVRVMGWCTARSPAPVMSAVLILLSRQPEDHLSAYNQVCPALRAKENTDAD